MDVEQDAPRFGDPPADRVWRGLVGRLAVNVEPHGGKVRIIVVVAKPGAGNLLKEDADRANDPAFDVIRRLQVRRQLAQLDAQALRILAGCTEWQEELAVPGE